MVENPTTFHMDLKLGGDDGRIVGHDGRPRSDLHKRPAERKRTGQKWTKLSGLASRNALVEAAILEHRTSCEL